MIDAKEENVKYICMENSKINLEVRKGFKQYRET